MAEENPSRSAPDGGNESAADAIALDGDVAMARREPTAVPTRRRNLIILVGRLRARFAGGMSVVALFQQL